MRRKIIKLFAFGFVLVLLLSGMFAGVPATVQAKSDYGLVAEWHFDEGSGIVVKDSSGNRNDGTIHGATWVDGKFGKALSFDGVDDYVDCGNDASLNPSDEITIEIWVKIPVLPSNQKAIVAKVGPPLSHDQYHFALDSDGRIFWTTNERDMWTISNSAISINQWTHVVVTAISGSNRKIYIDGQLDKNHDTTYAFDSTTNTAKIGYSDRWGSKSYFNGIIDEIRIYNRVLTADEIKTHYEGKQPELTLTKSASPSTIQEGETTTISIRVEDTGSGVAKSIEVTDTIPTGFKIISGSKSASFDKIKPGDYRTFEYTLKATGSGKFTCDPATATYKDDDGNSYSAASNSVSIQVGGEVPVGADSDGDGWSDEKEREMGTNPYSVDSDGDGLKDPEDPNPTVPEKKTPGFEIVFAIAGLLAVAYLLRRKK